jgi:hypothetical protein
MASEPSVNPPLRRATTAPRVTWVIEPRRGDEPKAKFDLSFELAEYNLGIGKFQRRDDKTVDDYSSDDEPDVRPPEHPYVPLRAPRQ